MDDPTQSTESSSPPSSTSEALPGGADSEVNPYPWFKPMPLMWLCVIICIVLIVVGSMMNQK